ncbi:hypothetical protein [Fodinicola acaciae]|uniref:hypothetical protein n=1 Tax=Fodinicola acaciae TaxID=2681555 RepID=UPI0013CFDC0B|nr:hypothetical protein [Fodinicola acaciae]
MRSGLSFCALHFTITSTGWVFTGVDPRARWDGFAIDLGLPLAEAIADALTL